MSSDGSMLVVKKTYAAEVVRRIDTRWALESQIPNTANDLARYVIAGDGERIAMAIPGSAVTIYVRAGATWVEEAVLVEPTAPAMTAFALGVAMSRDGGMVVVGGEREVRTFTRDGTTWTDGGSTTVPAQYVTSLAVSADEPPWSSVRRATVRTCPTEERPTCSFASVHRGRCKHACARRTRPSTTSSAGRSPSTMRGGDGTRLVVGAGGNDYFGVRIAVSRDGATIAVGAAGEESGSVDTPSDNSLQGAGAAYVFQ